MNSRIDAIVLVLLFAGATTTTHAQRTPLIDVAVSSTRMHDPHTEEISQYWTGVPLTFDGWLVSGAVNVTPQVAIVGEVDRLVAPYHSSYRSTDVRLRTYSFMGGPRVAWRGIPRLALFGQALFGRVRASYGIVGQPQAYSAVNAFAIKPEVGADFWVLSHVGVRGGAAWRRVYLGRRPNETVMHVGLVVRTGVH